MLIRRLRPSLVLGGLVLAGAMVAAGALAARAQTATTSPPVVPAGQVAAGQALFQVACSTCHGLTGTGTSRGPSLIGVGAAAADFYLSTGRMPLNNPAVQATRKHPAYSPLEIRQLTDYIASLGPGPGVPDIDPAAGNLAEGYQLYADNCASCHSSAGAGGALGHANYAPSLHQATGTQVAEAIRVGPGPMPVFGPNTFDDAQVEAIVRYVLYLHHPDDRGGLSLGHLGPIPEGFVAWVVGLGLLVVAVRWIGTRD